MILERLLIPIDGDPAGLTRALSQASTVAARGTRQIEGSFQIIHKSFDKAATGGAAAAVNITKVEHALKGMAISAVGANPHLSKLVFAIADLGLTSTVMLGAVAGAAALAFAFEHGKKASDDYAESIDKSVQSLRDLANLQDFGPTFAVRQQKADAQGRLQLVTDRLAPDEARLKGFQDRLAGDTSPSERIALEASVNQILARIGPDLNEKAELIRDIAAADREIAEIEARQAKDQEAAAKAADAAMTKTIAELTEKAMALHAAATFEVGVKTGLIDPGDQMRDDANTRSVFSAVAARAEAARRKRFLIGFTPDRITTPTDGSGLTRDAAGRFERAVDAFSGGVKQMIKGAFSADGLSNIGSQLASNAIGFVTGKLVSGIEGLLQGVDHLAEALDHNAQAMRASSSSLEAALSSSGLSGQAGAVQAALQATFDRAALGTLLPDRFGIRTGDINSTLAEELKKAGVDWDALTALADVLNIDITPLTRDTISQFISQIESATGELERFSGAMSNVPQGFKVALARFDSSEGRSASAGEKTASVSITGPVTVYANNPEEFGKKVRQMLRRGGAFPLTPAYE